MGLRQRALDKLVWLATPTPSPELQEWRRVDGDKTLRLQYDLGPDSVVVDVGGFEGQWASDIVAMYGCRVHVFEPVPAFAERIARRFARNPLVTVHSAGLGAEDRTETLWLAGDASSHERHAAGEHVEVDLRGVEGLFEELDRVDLLKLNVEGAEYELIAKLIDTGLIQRVVDLQVQFHSFVPDAEARMLALRERLSATHRPTYCFTFVWENWRRMDVD